MRKRSNLKSSLLLSKSSLVVERRRRKACFNQVATPLLGCLHKTRAGAMEQWRERGRGWGRKARGSRASDFSAPAPHHITIHAEQSTGGTLLLSSSSLGHGHKLFILLLLPFPAKAPWGLLAFYISWDDLLISVGDRL